MNQTPIALAGLALVLVSEPALALRPYDSTDADVAKQNEFELELGPVGRRREGSKRIEVAPAVIGNFGLEGDRELVIEGQRHEQTKGAHFEKIPCIDHFNSIIGGDHDNDPRRNLFIRS